MSAAGEARDAGGLRVAVVCPHSFPPRDDVARHARNEAAALARRGMRVTVLAPSADRRLVAAGRERLRRIAVEGPAAIAAEPGAPLELLVARALPAGRRRRLGGPLDLPDALNTALAGGAFDVVHLHEPLAPTPALATLRSAGCTSVATIHRPETLAGAAFLRPLIRRALDRLSVRVATGETVLRAAREVLPGEYALVRPGADPRLFAPPERRGAPPGIAIVARSRERAGLRFALSTLRGVAPEALGPIAVLGPGASAWRTQRIVPKAMRSRVEIVPDTDEEARAGLLRRSGLVLFASPEELIGPVLGDALSVGATVLVPRAPEIEGVLVHGRDALVLPPFAGAEGRAAVEAALADPVRTERQGREARAAHRSWDRVADELAEVYESARAAWSRRPAPSTRPVAADLRVRPSATPDAAAWVAAARGAGLGLLAVASPHGIAPALAIARAAPDDLAVVVGQEVATAEGVVIGLFLTREVPSGGPLADTVKAVREQGGVLVVPHPDVADAPPAAALRRIGAEVDCWEGVVAGAGRGAIEAARVRQRLGALLTAGSGASAPEQVGGAWTELRPFHGAADFLDAVAGAVLHARPPRRRARERARAQRSHRA